MKLDNFVIGLFVISSITIEVTTRSNEVFPS